jgi:predicted transcriptional regulator
MEVVYRLGGATASQVAEHLPDPPSYSAVRAMLSILEDKGHLRHEDQGNRYLYLPTVSADKARKRAIRDLVRTFFQGSPKQAVVALIDDAGRELSEKDLRELRTLVDEAIKQGR